MSLAGQGAVAIWNDINRESREKFYAWHGREHMPERVGIPGFQRGRRYSAVHGSPEYFTLYEAETPQVLTGQDYANRLNNPTPWTLDTITHLHNVSRSICRVAFTRGNAQGGLIATWRYDIPDEHAEAHRRELARRVLPEIAERPGVAGAHLLIADAAASAVDTAERKSRGEPSRVPRWILLLESWDDIEPFDAFCKTVFKDAMPAGDIAPRAAEHGLYRLQSSRAKMAWPEG